MNRIVYVVAFVVVQCCTSFAFAQIPAPGPCYKYEGTLRCTDIVEVAYDCWGCNAMPNPNDPDHPDFICVHFNWKNIDVGYAVKNVPGYVYDPESGTGSSGPLEQTCYKTGRCNVNCTWIGTPPNYSPYCIKNPAVQWDGTKISSLKLDAPCNPLLPPLFP